jgi:flagellar L-ring protein precursor FlgH
MTHLMAVRGVLLGSLVLLLVLVGCANVDAYRVPPVDVGAQPPVVASSVEPPIVANGAIYQSAAYRPLFEDHRARLPGDTLTVQIVEKVSASQKSTSSIDKSGELSGAISALPGQAPTPSAARRSPAPAATPSAARARPRAATTSPARSPSLVDRRAAQRPPADPGEKQIGVKPTSTCCASRARSTRARSSRQQRAERAGRQRARRAPRPRPAGRRPGDRLAVALLPDLCR